MLNLHAKSIHKSITGLDYVSNPSSRKQNDLNCEIVTNILTSDNKVILITDKCRQIPIGKQELSLIIEKTLMGKIQLVSLPGLGQQYLIKFRKGGKIIEVLVGPRYLTSAMSSLS